ncbi:MAG: kelch repeat-containing protein [Pseudomonadota bacterium]
MMTEISRRLFVAGGLAVGAAPAFAHETSKGVWRPLADMPFPVQEIYPAPFWKTPATRSLKPTPFNIVVNAGGLTPDRPFNVTDETVWYDPETNSWSSGPRLPAPRHHLNLVNNNGYLYGVGGFARDAGGGWRMRADCWRLGDINGEWTSRRSLPAPQGEAVCISLGGYIHIVGGRAPKGSRNLEWDDHIDTDKHRIYDAGGDRWYDAAPMPTPRNSAAGAVVSGVLYVFGGRTVSAGNTTAAEVYDPLADRWDKCRPMPKGQAGLAAAAINGKIYVFGGEFFGAGGDGVFPDAWEYDPRTDRWRSVAPMPRPRHGLGAVAIGDKIYVIGGALEAGGSETSAAAAEFSMPDA